MVFNNYSIYLKAEMQSCVIFENNIIFKKSIRALCPEKVIF